MNTLPLDTGFHFVTWLDVFVAPFCHGKRAICRPRPLAVSTSVSVQMYVVLPTASAPMDTAWPNPVRYM